jgi:tRNA A37 threonylcarbamoyladenosine biosynthesis protein TsaE
MAKVVVIKGDPNAGKTTASRFILQVLLIQP